MDLSRVETQRLFDLARDKSIAGRQALTATVSDLFFAPGTVMTDRERSLMTDILRQLIGDLEISVRRALAEKLAHYKDAPRDLVLTLANDESTVAHAILIHSEVLRDEDLVEIIRHRALEHQLAIAMRRSLNEMVSDALVEAGNVDVIKTLLENHDARISAATMAYLVEQSQRVDTYQNPLVRRLDLPPELARRMYWWVSAALRQHILDNFPMQPSAVDDALEATVTDLSAAAVGQPPSKAEALADAIARAEAITPEFLVQSLRQGEIALFEAMFAKLTGIRPILVRRLLYDHSGEGLAAACRGVGISAPNFASIFLLSRKARPHEPPPARGEITRIVNFFENISVEAARQLVMTWQRDRNFPHAVLHRKTPSRSHAAS